MGNKKENTKKRCKKCGAEVDYFDYCKECGKKVSNILVITENNFGFHRSVNFYKLKLIEYFIYHDTVVLSFLPVHSNIAVEVISQTKHMGYFIGSPRQKKLKNPKPPYNEVESTEIPLDLIPTVRGLKQDRKKEDKFNLIREI